MQKVYDEDTDLAIVSEYLASYGLSTRRFSRDETLSGRTPDFRLFREGEIIAYCEVKSPNDPWLDSLLNDSSNGKIVGGMRHDPVFNRLARLLTKADTQFAAVNPDRSKLNILAYVNHDNMCSFADLRETLTGFFHASDGSKHPTMTNLSEGVIGKAKRRIDAFLWFETGKTRCQKIINNEVEPARLQMVCDLFRIDSQKLR